MRIFHFFFTILIIALGVASKNLNEVLDESHIGKRHSYYNPVSLLRAALNGEDGEEVEKGTLTARQLVRGPRYLFWRFSLTTTTQYSATSTSTSTTTCTRSTSLTCSGRRRRSYLLEEDFIAPSNVLPVEATPMADLETVNRHSRKADPYYYISSPSELYRDHFPVRPGLIDSPYRYNQYPPTDSFIQDDEGYDSFYDDFYEPLLMPSYQRPHQHQYKVNQRRWPQEIPSIESASFRRLFLKPFSLFSTFTLTVTTTTGTLTAFTRVTETSTPSCSTPGVYAQCPTG